MEARVPGAEGGVVLGVRLEVTDWIVRLYQAW